MAKSLYNQSLKLIFLYTAIGRNSYSDTALDCFGDQIKYYLPNAEIKKFVLPAIIQELSTKETLAAAPQQVAEIGEAMLESDIWVIATPIYNFTYSCYLQTLFHMLRTKFITLDEQGKIASRNLPGKRAYFILTGRSSKLKWFLFTRFIMKAQISLLFRFWGARLAGLTFIGDCHPNQLDINRPRLIKIIQKAAWKFTRKYLTAGPKMSVIG